MTVCQQQEQKLSRPAFNPQQDLLRSVFLSFVFGAYFIIQPVPFPPLSLLLLFMKMDCAKHTRTHTNTQTHKRGFTNTETFILIPLKI